MTRINCAISVKCLTDEHLLAEHREIKRMPSCFDKAKNSGALNRIPKKFCLGTGHVTFFLDKYCFTFNRYKQIYNECIRRGFNVGDYSTNWDNVVDDVYCKNYIATNEDRNILIQRISERILNSTKKCFHYNGNVITKENAIKILNNI